MGAFWRLVRINPVASVVVGAGLLVLSLVLWQQWRNRRNAEDAGKWKAVAQRLQQDSAQAANAIRRTDSVFFRDTVHLRTVLNHYETRRDTVLRNLTDTVRVREFVEQSDSAVAACLAVVSTCEQRVADRDSLLRIVSRQRNADRERYRAQLAQARPRVLPYLEGMVDPADTRTLVARGGLEVRLFGPVKLTAAGQYTTTGDHQFRALAGVRVTF